MPNNTYSKRLILGQPSRRAERSRDTTRQFQLATALYKDALRQQVQNEQQAQMLLRVSQLLDEREVAFQNLLLNQAASRLHEIPPESSGIPPMANYTDEQPAYNPLFGKLPQGMTGDVRLHDPALLSRFVQ